MNLTLTLDAIKEISKVKAFLYFDGELIPAGEKAQGGM